MRIVDLSDGGIVSDDIQKEHFEIFKGELSGSREGLHAGTMMSALQDDHHINQKKARKESAEFMHEIVQLQAELDGLLDEMNMGFEALRESIAQQSKIQNALKHHDWDTIRSALIEDYHLNPDAVRDMSPDELEKAAKTFIDEETLTQQKIIENIKGLARKYNEVLEQTGQVDPEVAAEYGRKLYELEEQAKSIDGLDFKKAFGECFQSDQGNDFYQSGFNHNRENEYDMVFGTKRNIISDPFNAAALGEGLSSPFNTNDLTPEGQSFMPSKLSPEP